MPFTNNSALEWFWAARHVRVGLLMFEPVVEPTPRVTAAGHAVLKARTP